MQRPEATAEATERMHTFNAETVQQIRAAVEVHAVVVVGMGWNPHVARARRALDAAGVRYHYLGIGNYLSGWRRRLAVKLWSGWPTFPQVYVDRVLIGGADEAVEWIAQRGDDRITP